MGIGCPSLMNVSTCRCRRFRTPPSVCGLHVQEASPEKKIEQWRPTAIPTQFKKCQVLRPTFPSMNYDNFTMILWRNETGSNITHQETWLWLLSEKLESWLRFSNGNPMNSVWMCKNNSQRKKSKTWRMNYRIVSFTWWDCRMCVEWICQSLPWL